MSELEFLPSHIIQHPHCEFKKFAVTRVFTRFFNVIGRLEANLQRHTVYVVTVSLHYKESRFSMFRAWKATHAIIRPRASSAIAHQSINKPWLMLEAKHMPLTQRALSTAVPNSPNFSRVNPSLDVLTSKHAVYEALDAFKGTNNARLAVNLVKKAQEQQLTTPETYHKLLQVVNSPDLDVDASATVARWFYDTKTSPLPTDIRHNLDVWKDLFKLGFRLSSMHRREDLQALVTSFLSTFEMTLVTDQLAWELLFRSYGILHQAHNLDMWMDKIMHHQFLTDSLDMTSLKRSAILAYAACGSTSKGETLMDSLEQTTTALPQEFWEKLIENCAYRGDIRTTSKYIRQCQQLFPDYKQDTMPMMAHKVALEQLHNSLAKSRGVRGLPLKTGHNPRLDALHESWAALTENRQHWDVVQCTIAVDYLRLANRIDPQNFPMSKARDIIDKFMPAHGLKPDAWIYETLLRGYATTREYSSNHNERLEKSLQVMDEMQKHGYDISTQNIFHLLFLACIPHRYNRYPFDYFLLASMLPPSPAHLPLDPRLFEIEKIMLKAQIRHTRMSIKTLLTCLGASGQYKAMWNRWRLIKLSGMRRDLELYRHVFALASLDSQQANYALAVIKNELAREHRKEKITWNTYCAMLDCAVAAQLPSEAKQIMTAMREPGLVRRYDQRPKLDTAEYYLPLVRACSAIEGLQSDAGKLLDEMKQKQVPYNQGIWVCVMTHAAVNKADREEIQTIFNRYTMERFERSGKIPIPVRELSPVVPFPSAPYNTGDVQMMNMYMGSLLDSQDVSLILDVLEVIKEQAPDLKLSPVIVQGVLDLARREKSPVNLDWLTKSNHVA
ncbi:uncharacterized protein BYT42DRAFT_562969 [Radiomyces spectabilis]|uniref:uncharacterized protein n=1 Tax=Radiomyces spectabilis TaxID=64574 RepID=UPI00221F1E7A|nr:uncharacterized protein BYT42DRAFT_562969 [Radiomyces spectabilis]KAI8384581.1 hypothetical protein BYT42DRAFT_562969 [Radiomyces spectabilis]